MPKKVKDSGGFVINCVVGHSVKAKALADSRASINVMLYKLFLKHGLGELRPTQMTLQ